MTFLAILLILLMCLATGYGVLSFLIPADAHFRSDRLEILFLTLITGVLLNSWVIFVLTEFSQFSATALAIFSMGMLALGLGRQMSNKQRSIISPQAKLDTLHWEIGSGNYLPVWVEGVFIAGWLIIAILLFFRPHEHIWGAADIGVYINYAAHISQSGSLIINDPLLTDIPADLAPYFVGRAEASRTAWSYLTPALDIKDFSGRIYPSFYHLHPIWQAVGWSIGGLTAGQMVTPLWGLLSTLCFYFLIRHLLPKNLFLLALVGLAAFSITALQVWFVRYGTTEPLTQLLFLSGLLALCRWNLSTYQSWIWGLLAGIAWGLTFLVRIDTFFIGLVPAVMLMLTVLDRFSWKNFLIFSIPFSLLAVHGTLHSSIFSPEYISRLTTYMSNVALGSGLPLILGAIFIIGLAALSARFFKDKILTLFTPIRFLSAFIILIYFIYGWFFRPADGTPIFSTLNGVPVESWNHENLIRLGWYLMPFGVWAAFAGVLNMLLHKRWTHWYILIPSLFYLIFYTWNLRSNAIQIYVMRRYVPMVLPFVMLATLLLWGRLLAHRQQLIRLSGLLLTIIWCVGLAWGTRGFASRVDYVGAPQQLSGAVGQLPVESIILFNQTDPVGVGDFLALPLRFFHGHHVFVLRDTASIPADSLANLVEEWQQAGFVIFWADLDPESHDNPVWASNKFDQEQSYPVLLETDALESVYGSKPTNVLPIVWNFNIVKIK